MEWQPIDSAPTDGEAILVSAPSEDAPGEWCFDLVEAHEYEFEGDGWGITRNIAPYTHWTRLLPPGTGEVPEW